MLLLQFIFASFALKFEFAFKMWPSLGCFIWPKAGKLLIDILNTNAGGNRTHVHQVSGEGILIRRAARF